MWTGASYDPAALAILKDAFEAAVARLPLAAQTSERKTIIASRILAAAALGERDPVRLFTVALEDTKTAA
ncbi:MAG: hypothetical protein AB7F37_01810 [Variibacter sp.]